MYITDMLKKWFKRPRTEAQCAIQNVPNCLFYVVVRKDKYTWTQITKPISYTAAKTYLDSDCCYEENRNAFIVARPMAF